MNASTTTPIEHDLAIIATIERALEDVAAGRVVPHDSVTAAARSIIEKSKQPKG